MQYDRYYYSVLNKQEKEVYKLIYKGIENLDTSIKIPAKFCIGVDLSDIIQKILLDNPHIFYINRNGYQITSSPFYCAVNFDYLYSAKKIAGLRVKINNAVNAMLKRVTGTTELEKEKSVYDLICNNVSYTYNAVDNMQKYSSVSNTILGVLFYKTAVCEGIALTIKLLLNMLDIKCIVALGHLNNEWHAWNIVKIDGQNYHLDATNDLKERTGILTYNFFNLTDEEILKTHSFAGKYPVCGNKNDMSVTGNNSRDGNTKVSISRQTSDNSSPSQGKGLIDNIKKFFKLK